jgi:hypothetical protein
MTHHYCQVAHYCFRTSACDRNHRLVFVTHLDMLVFLYYDHNIDGNMYNYLVDQSLRKGLRPLCQFSPLAGIGLDYQVHLQTRTDHSLPLRVRIIFHQSTPPFGNHV